MHSNTSRMGLMIGVLLIIGGGMATLGIPTSPWSTTAVVEAQVGDFRGFHKTFPAQTAVGATATTGLMRGLPINHTAELIVTGAPTTCTYRLQGSRDGITWFNLSAADVSCVATTVAFESNKPAVTVRGNLVTLTGGTAPTITLKYIGK